MLNVLLTAFLAFSASSGELNFVNSLSSSNDGDISFATSYYQPSINIQYGSYDVDWWYEGFVGRHQMISLESSEYLGMLTLKQLTEFFNPNMFSTLTFTRTIKTISTSTVSTTESFSSKTTSSIGVKVGLDNVSASSEYKITQSYTIENTVTYSYSQEEELSVSFNVDKEAVGNRNFCLGSVGYVYKVKCQAWQYDNWWWGDYEVDGSRFTFYSYVTLNPTLTLCFEDGTFLN